jgi:murein DD-endopeptidase MepM/ murein hydrolase activator NlpD
VTYPDWATSPYVLPYPVGITHQVDLSNCSASYHSRGQPDEMATDFDMDIGTAITASRAGTVVHVEERGVDYDFPNNRVVVDHGDGTFAQYMHLTLDGAEVEVDDVVEPGDTIGWSGATGLAGYPHLHFVVTANDWSWPYVSAPVTFSNTDPNPRGLRSFQPYTALPY